MKFFVLTLAIMISAVACNRDEKSTDAGTGSVDQSMNAPASESNMESEMAPAEVDAPAGTDSDIGSGAAPVDSADDSGTDMGSGSAPMDSSDLGSGSDDSMSGEGSEIESGSPDLNSESPTDSSTAP